MPFAPLGQLAYAIIGFIQNVLVPLIFSLAFLTFIWGVFRFFIAGGADKEKREEGRKFIMWGLIGFVLMFSLWGIVNVLVNSLGFNNARPSLPLFGPAPAFNANWNGNGNNNGGWGNTGTVVDGQTGPNCGWTNLWLCPDGLDCAQGVCINQDGT